MSGIRKHANRNATQRAAHLVDRHVRCHHVGTLRFVPGSFPTRPKIKGMPMPTHGSTAKPIQIKVMAVGVCSSVIPSLGTRGATKSPMIAAATNPAAIQRNVKVNLLAVCRLMFIYT
jgi:hypothetical protein